jgi:hypothetical protein
LHEVIHDELGAESIIPATKVRKGTKPRKPYRKKMTALFKTNPKIYKHRWQVETVFSMIKRNLSTALKARKPYPQYRELALLALTHNIMISAALFYYLLYLFYRARRRK